MFTLKLSPDVASAVIAPEIYGHFAEHLGRCIYGGLYAGLGSALPNDQGARLDVVHALKALGVPVLRWPGGCFADEYHWKDGIGPLSNRKRMINTHWGGVLEDNSFGTHEFFTLCELIGAKPYISGNVGSGTVQEMSEWVEYITFQGESPMANLRRQNGREAPWALPYWGVGNESWGCGGNMTADFYADQFKRYATYVRDYEKQGIERIACGACDARYEWTEILMEKAGNPQLMQGLSLHYYTVPHSDWAHKGSATDFSLEEYDTTLQKARHMETLVGNHAKIMDKYDPEKKIGMIVDEWGAWYDCEPGTNPGFLYQQNTLRDAQIAAIHFNGFHRHADRVKMANLAQTVNVLQALILTDDTTMIKTPTYHAFDLYKPHRGAQFVELGMEMGGAIDATASVKDGVYTVTINNASASEPETVVITGIPTKTATARILSGKPTDKYTFEAPDAVSIHAHPVEIRTNEMHLNMPPCSIVTIEIAV